MASENNQINRNLLFLGGFTGTSDVAFGGMDFCKTMNSTSTIPVNPPVIFILFYDFLLSHHFNRKVLPRGI
jgi:hypothetical protein